MGPRPFRECKVMPGYADPPKETQWRKGQSGNPGGKTAEHRKAEIAAAEKAAKLQMRMLEALEGMFNEHPEKERVTEYIKGDVLRLVGDALDRGFGKAIQAVDMTSSDGTMSPKEVIIRGANAKRDD
jgi:hypothetical protein